MSTHTSKRKATVLKPEESRKKANFSVIISDLEEAANEITLRNTTDGTSLFQRVALKQFRTEQEIWAIVKGSIDIRLIVRKVRAAVLKNNLIHTLTSDADVKVQLKNFIHLLDPGAIQVQAQYEKMKLQNKSFNAEDIAAEVYECCGRRSVDVTEHLLNNAAFVAEINAIILQGNASQVLKEDCKLNPACIKYLLNLHIKHQQRIPIGVKGVILCDPTIKVPDKLSRVLTEGNVHFMSSDIPATIMEQCHTAGVPVFVVGITGARTKGIQKHAIELPAARYWTKLACQLEIIDLVRSYVPQVQDSQLIANQTLVLMDKRPPPSTFARYFVQALEAAGALCHYVRKENKIQKTVVNELSKAQTQNQNFYSENEVLKLMAKQENPIKATTIAPLFRWECRYIAEAEIEKLSGEKDQWMFKSAWEHAYESCCRGLVLLVPKCSKILTHLGVKQIEVSDREHAQLRLSLRLPDCYQVLGFDPGSCSGAEILQRFDTIDISDSKSLASLLNLDLKICEEAIQKWSVPVQHHQLGQALCICSRRAKTRCKALNELPSFEMGNCESLEALKAALKGARNAVCGKERVLLWGEDAERFGHLALSPGTQVMRWSEKKFSLSLFLPGSDTDEEDKPQQQTLEHFVAPGGLSSEILTFVDKYIARSSTDLSSVLLTLAVKVRMQCEALHLSSCALMILLQRAQYVALSSTDYTATLKSALADGPYYCARWELLRLGALAGVLAPRVLLAVNIEPCLEQIEELVAQATLLFQNRSTKAPDQRPAAIFYYAMKTWKPNAHYTGMLMQVALFSPKEYLELAAQRVQSALLVVKFLQHVTWDSHIPVIVSEILNRSKRDDLLVKVQPLERHTDIIKSWALTGSTQLSMLINALQEKA
jgi:hypothetical protein